MIMSHGWLKQLHTTTWCHTFNRNGMGLVGLRSGRGSGDSSHSSSLRDASGKEKRENKKIPINIGTWLGHTPLGNGALLSAEAKIRVEHCDVTDETYTSNNEPLVDTDNETGNRYD